MRHRVVRALEQLKDFNVPKPRIGLVVANCQKSSSVIHHLQKEFSHQKLSLDSLHLEHQSRRYKDSAND